MENEMTVEGLEALKAEVEELEGPRRRELAEEIKTARGHGDLKENAEYHAAKDAQAHLETRIQMLRHRILHANIVEITHGDVIAFGSTVEVEDEETGKRSTYTLVSSREADLANGKLSSESPVAAALSGLRAGGVAKVKTPKGHRRLKILKVS